MNTRAVVFLLAGLAVCSRSEPQPYNTCIAWWLETGRGRPRFAQADAESGARKAGQAVDAACLEAHLPELVALSDELCPAGRQDPLLLRDYQAALAARLAELCPAPAAS